MRNRIYSCFWVCACVVLIPLGCGNDEGLGKLYPGSGVVSLKGVPVPSATINFVPIDPSGHSAIGIVQQGKFPSVTTLRAADGMLPGKYRVTVVSLPDVNPANIKSDAVTGGDMDQVAVGKAANMAKNDLPARYSNIGTSGLEVEAKTQSNTFDIRLE